MSFFADAGMNVMTPRHRIGRALAVLSMGLLCGAPLALTAAWISAVLYGWVPETWGTFEGNHGPWRHYSLGRDMIGYALMFPIGSLLVSLTSILFKPTTLAGVIFVISGVGFFALLASHYWLID